MIRGPAWEPSASICPSPVATTSTASPSADSRFLPGATIAGRYRIVGLLGKGGVDAATARPVDPTWNPIVSRNPVAWEAKLSGSPERAVRVEAGSFNGRPVFAAVLAYAFRIALGRGASRAGRVSRV